jgi:hypothetical protein
MGLFSWLLGDGDNNSHNNQNVNGSYNNLFQDNSVHNGGDGPSCPFNWQIGYGTCGVCPKSNGCEKWHNLKRNALRDMSDY